MSEWLATEELAGLGPDRRPGALSIAEIDAKLPKTDPSDRARLVRAVLYLWHDHLDESHRIAQEIENPDGSLVHAMMHRREPDFWNSKYWLRRAGPHPAFAKLGPRAAELLARSGNAPLARRLAPQGRWDACAFVDAVEEAGPREVELLKQVQKLEFEAVLAHLSA